MALVGKGVTFDTGGISIKPAANMDHMTSDMSGAAAVVATTVLAARLELPVAVTATVPMAENMPSATPRTGPATCCACTAAGPSRCSTPTPKAG